MKKSYVYIMANKPKGTLYIGVTTNLIKRVWIHKNKILEGFTKKYNVILLVYFEVYTDLRDAVSREMRLKEWKRDWKIQLIETKNPDWCDLWEEIL